MGNLVFPLNIAGAQPNLRRAPVYATEIQTTSSGLELRASWQSYPRYKYTLSIEVLRSDAVFAEFQRVASAFSSAMGQYGTFLIVDPNDSVASNMGFGVTDGSSTAFQLQRTLGGVLQSGYWDPVAYPINTTPRSNLLLQSNNFADPAWGKTNLSPLISGASPDGATPFWALADTTNASTTHFMSQSAVVPAAAGPFTFSFYVNTTASFGFECNFVFVQMADSIGNTFASVCINVLTGAVSGLSAGTNWSNPSCTITPLGYGNWSRLSITATKTNAATGITVYIVPAQSSATGVYAGFSNTATLFVWGFQLEAGAAPTQYLPTTSVRATDTPAYWPNFGDGFEPITEINSGTLQISLNNVVQPQWSSWNHLGAGLINFASTPASGQALTWSGNYFRRVRFASDELELERIFGQLWAGKTVDFISIK